MTTAVGPRTRPLKISQRDEFPPSGSSEVLDEEPWEVMDRIFARQRELRQVEKSRG